MLEDNTDLRQRKGKELCGKVFRQYQLLIDI